MCNLLFFASDYKIGLSSLLTDQLISIYKNGINVFAISGEQEQEQGLKYKLKKLNIPIYFINGLDKHSHIKFLTNSICEIILKNNITTIHVQNNWQLAIISYVRLKLILKKRLKVIYTIHGFRNNSKIKSRIAQIIITIALLLFANKIICTSSFLKNKFKFLSFKISLLPLGISDGFFPETKPEIPSHGLQMIFPAQFRKGKNQDTIINAFAVYLKQSCDASSHLTLPGNGPFLNDMIELSYQLGISNRITFPGLCSKNEIYNLYLKSNIGIISSSSETFGQCIVEPFVLGRCVITSPVGIATDIIKNGENGFFFNNVDELIKIFLFLNNNKSLLSQISINNFSLRNQFCWSNISEQYANIIHTLE